MLKKMFTYLKRSLDIYLKNDINAASSQLAYNLLFSFSPIIIVIITILGYSSISNEEIINLLKNVLPKDIIQLTEKAIIDVTSSKRIGLLSFSMIITIFSASAGVGSIIGGLNKAYDEKENRNFLKLQFITLAFTIVLLIIFFLSFILIVFGEVEGKFLVKFMGYSKASEIFIDIGRYVLGTLLLFITFSLVYRFASAKKLTLKYVIPGSLFSTLGIIIFSLCFSYYVNNFGNYSQIYGSLGAVIVLMTWLYLCSNIILIGGELNAAYHRQKEIAKPV